MCLDGWLLQLPIYLQRHSTTPFKHLTQRCQSDQPSICDASPFTESSHHLSEQAGRRLYMCLCNHPNLFEPLAAFSSPPECIVDTAVFASPKMNSKSNRPDAGYSRPSRQLHMLDFRRRTRSPRSMCSRTLGVSHFLHRIWLCAMSIISRYTTFMEFRPTTSSVDRGFLRWESTKGGTSLNPLSEAQSPPS